jgi:hypothetical protein
LRKMHGATRGMGHHPGVKTTIINLIVRAGLTAVVLAARAALAARSAGARNRFVHDPADRTRTASALGAATEAAVNLAGGARRSLRREGGPDVLVGQHVARTDDHGNPAVPARLVQSATIDT